MTNPTAPGMTEELESLDDLLSALEYIKQLNGHNACDVLTRAQKRITALALRAEENERDGARLEFMVTHPEYRIVKSRNSSEWSAMDCSNGLTFVGRGYKSMRDAIDAAISALDSDGGGK